MKSSTFLRRMATSAWESSMDWLPHSVHWTLWLMLLARDSTVWVLMSSSLIIAQVTRLPQLP